MAKQHIIHVNDNFLTKMDFIKNFDSKELTHERSGIIPYIRDGKHIFLCVGKDYVYESYTDFGGHVDSGNENSLMGGLREFKEETLDVFKFDKIDENSLAISSRTMMIMFVEIKINGDAKQYMKDIKESFLKKICKEMNVEVDDMIWMNKVNFIELLEEKPEILYHKVSKLLNQAYLDHGDFLQFL